MPNLVQARAELVEINPAASAAQRINEYVQNIEILCNAVHREIILLGQQLADCKWSGTYLVDPMWAEASNNPALSWEEKLGSRSWANWLAMHDFRLKQEKGETVIAHKQAASLMAWSACYGTLATANERRRPDDQLPYPTNPAQVQPYQGFFSRVDDFNPEVEWPEEVKAQAHNNALRDTEGPYTDHQPIFLAKWEEVCNLIPIEKRLTRRGELVPPPRDFSADHFKRQREQERLERELAAARERENQERPNEPEEQPPTLNVGDQPQTSETQGRGADAAGRNQVPPKSSAQLEAEAFEYALVQDIIEYRNRLHDLRLASKRLEGTLQNILSRGGDARLALMRQRPDMGINSVHDDLELMRGAVELIQSAYRLATEPYTPHASIAREETAADALVDI